MKKKKILFVKSSIILESGFLTDNGSKLYCRSLYLSLRMRCCASRPNLTCKVNHMILLLAVT